MIPLTEKHNYETYTMIYDKIEETKTRLKDKGEATTTTYSAYLVVINYYQTDKFMLRLTCKVD